MTAAEARSISKQNQTTEQQVEDLMFSSAMRKIVQAVGIGAEWEIFDKNAINAGVQRRLEELGYTVQFKKGRLLMDADTYRVEW